MHELHLGTWVKSLGGESVEIMAFAG